MATALRAVAIIVMLKGLEKRKFNLEVKLEKIAYTIRTARTISGFPSDGHRPSVCGLEPPIQEPDVQHPTRPCSRIEQFRRFTKGTQYALSHPYHAETHGQGLEGDLPFGNDYQQLFIQKDI